MKIEPCEPCEWADIHSEARHFVGWDQMPLCDMHFELDKLGQLGNWVNENVDFPEPSVVHSGMVKMKPVGNPFRAAQEAMFLKEPDAESVLRKLENDAWLHLGKSQGGGIANLAIVRYLIEVLDHHGVDVSDLETSADNI